MRYGNSNALGDMPGALLCGCMPPLADNRAAVLAALSNVNA
jgi:hypothetical protein